jgi:hypothetical protein
MRDRTEPTHRVYMQFVLRNGWQVSFLEADLATSLPAALTLYRSGEDQRIGSARQSVRHV